MSHPVKTPCPRQLGLRIHAADIAAAAVDPEAGHV
jgi:hypothetical protein